MPDGRVLVVGTTADYIDLINRRYPGRALFVTDPAERRQAAEAPPEPGGELLCDLRDVRAAHEAVMAHLAKWGQEVTGITSYDCESMLLAAELASRFGLSYPEPESIRILRDKFRSKQIWRERGLDCPRAALVSSENEAAGFAEEIQGPVVIKPRTGSGSELTFRCDTEAECRRAFRAIKSGLARRAGLRMYSSPGAGSSDRDLRTVFEMEELVEGPEYSCDFIVDGDQITIIRLAWKLRSDRLPFGTTLAYVLPSRLPDGLTEAEARRTFREAARAAGLHRAICMVDFIVRNDRFCLLELTPRPGGDCLPPLIMRSCGLDPLGMALDFAENRPISIPPPSEWRRLVGWRVFAEDEGKIEHQDASVVRAHPAVAECYLKRRPGHVVKLPPEEYDSWLLGHIIFRPSSLAERVLEREGEMLASRLIIEFEIRHDRKRRQPGPAAGRVAEATDTAAGASGT